MPIIEPIIRPPSEAYSFLLQVTTGCSSNSCTFCAAYKNKDFIMKSREEIFSDISAYAVFDPDVRRIFLMDGDALALSNVKLLPVLDRLIWAFPGLSRVSSYANGNNIKCRSDLDLRDLYEKKMSLIYMGLESGSQKILDMHKKRSSVEEMVEAVNRCSSAGIKSSVIVLLGLGGRKYSSEHVNHTITALNRMQPRYLSFLSVMVVPGTELHDMKNSGDFILLSQQELLLEAYEILKGLELKRTVFRSDHASNYLSLEGRLGADKVKLLDQLKAAIDGRIGLRSESLRGL